MSSWCARPAGDAVTAWTSDLKPFRSSFLPLEATASAAYNQFVYRDGRQGDEVRGLLFDRGVGEFADRYTSAMVEDGEVACFISALLAPDLRLCRMRSALAIAKGGFFGDDPALHGRMQLAGTTVAPVEDGDCYVSRVAVSPRCRGQGRAGLLLERAQELAVAGGATRLILEVARGNEAGLKLYRKHGFELVDQREVGDPATGRSLALIHMAKAI